MLEVGTFEVALREAPVLIGRLAECMVRSDDSTMTRRHARIELADGHHVLTDLGSDNGTWVDDERLCGPWVLRSGDRIRCGPLVLRYVVG